MRTLFVSVATLMFAGSVLATTPPTIPSVLPPQVSTGPEIVPPPDPIVPPTQPLTKESLDKLHLSPSAYRVMLNYLIQQGVVPGKTVADAPHAPFRQHASGSAVQERTRNGRFTVAPFTSVSSTDQVDNDSNEDTESSTIVQRYPAGGTDYPIVAYMKFYVPNTTQARDYVRSTVNNTNVALPLATGYDRSADPVLSENPYSSGVNAKYVYCVGTMYNIANNNFGDTAIPMWYSANAGSTWNGPYNILSYASGSGWFLDRPAITTSWNTNSLGVTYVAFIQSPLSGNTSNTMIKVYRLDTNGSTTFSYRSTPVSTTHNVQTPQLVVDPNDGDVYLFWIDFSNATINVARSTDQGGSFPTTYSFSSPNMLSDANDTICDAGNTCVQARTGIDARFNNYDLSIGVAWHAHESSTSGDTNVYFNKFNPYTFPMSWSSIKTVNYTTTNDQWHPALDVDENGTYIVAYYDSRNSTSTSSGYQVFSTKLDSSGNRLPTSTSADTQIDPTSGSALSNISAYTAAFGYAGGQRTLGEYQGMWYWYSTWYNSHVFIPSTQGDIYQPHIAP